MVVAYLDHAAATSVRPEVLEAVGPLLDTLAANPTATHAEGRAARHVLDDAREEVAELCGAIPGGVVFTGGGTEADNLAVTGVVRACGIEAPQVLVSAIEHKAVLEPAQHLARRGEAELALLGVNGEGLVDLHALAASLGPSTALVSVMTANNELGTIQPIVQIAAAIANRAPHAVLHTDAVQAAPWLDLCTAARGADLVTLSGHKLGGLKGVGALVLRRRVPLEPLIVGGAQELGLRSGTQDVLGAVSLAVALRCAVADRDHEVERVRALRRELWQRLEHDLGAQVHQTVPSAPSLPGHLHLSVLGVDAEELLVALDRAGVCASGGSSCASGALEANHVLEAIALPPTLRKGAIRLTLGRTTTAAEVEAGARAIVEVVRRLQAA